MRTRQACAREAAKRCMVMGQTILVVDDDKQIVRLVRAYLEQAGYQVIVAHDGDTALQSIRRDRPDLIVLDLMLPDKDGWEITRLVRSDPSVANCPIIMLTARVEDTDRIVGLEMGADDYITVIFRAIMYRDFRQRCTRRFRQSCTRDFRQ